MSEVENLLSMVKKACFEADMLPGSNIYDLPAAIKKLRRERNLLEGKLRKIRVTSDSSEDSIWNPYGRR